MNKPIIMLCCAVVLAALSFTVFGAPMITFLGNHTTPYAYEVNTSVSVASNASVEYGRAVTLGTVTASSSVNNTNHSILLRALIPGTVYYYNVTACYNASVCNTTGPHTFTTVSRSQYPTAHLDGGGVFSLNNFYSVWLGAGGLPADNITDWSATCPDGYSSTGYSAGATNNCVATINTTGGQSIAGSLNFSDGSGLPDLMVNSTEMTVGAAQYNINKPIRIAGLVYVDDEGLKFARTVDINGDGSVIGLDLQQNGSEIGAYIHHTGTGSAVYVEADSTGPGIYSKQDGAGYAHQFECNANKECMYMVQAGTGASSYGVSLLAPNAYNKINIGKSTTGDQYGLYVYRDLGPADTTNPLARFIDDNSTNDQVVVFLQQDGNKEGLTTYMNGNGTGVYVDSDAIGNDKDGIYAIMNSQYVNQYQSAVRGKINNAAANAGNAVYGAHQGTGGYAGKFVTANGATTIFADQNGNGVAVEVDSESTTQPAINIQDVPSNKAIVQVTGNYHCFNGACTMNITANTTHLILNGLTTQLTVS